MAESGGHTMNIQFNIWDSSGGYYGICQWSLEYNPQLSGVDLTTQLEHLVSSMEYEFNTFGKNYKSRLKYADFVELTDTKEATLAFAKCYERCSSSTYSKRQKNAIKAYEYFTSWLQGYRRNKKWFEEFLNHFLYFMYFIEKICYNIYIKKKGKQNNGF